MIMATAAPTKTTDSARNEPGSWKSELFEIPVDRVDPSLSPNVRRDVGDVDELAASIRELGVLSPIRVEEAGPNQDGLVRYALVYGQRRLAAAKAAGLTHVPAIVDVRNRTGAQMAIAQLVENVQRAELNPLEEARGYRALLDTGLTQRQVAERVGKAQPTIANALRLLKVPEAIQARITAGELSASHVKAIATLPATEQEELARRAVEHKLSHAQVEDEVQRAVGRQTAEDRRRTRRTELLAGWLALLLKKRANPETTTLVGWAGIPADGLADLAKRGWERSQSAARGADQAWRAPAPKGFCDCDAYELTYRLDWRSSGETLHAQVHPACIVKEHQVAADKAERKAHDAQQAEQREAERKAAEERAAALAPLAVAVTTPIPPTKAKLILFVALGGGQDNGYWVANSWALARNGAEGIAYDHWQDHLWAAIDELPHEQLLTEIAQLVAAAAVDAGGRVRAAIDELVGPPEQDNSQAAAAKRVAAKHAARRAAKAKAEVADG
jgi:ParB/RepB/Spo0J family partition protein